MSRFLDIFGFLAVLLRGGTLIFTAMVVGAVVFASVVLRQHGLAQEERRSAMRIVRRLLVVTSAGLAMVDGTYLAANSALLMGTLQVGLPVVAGAAFFISSCVSLASSLVLLAGTRGRAEIGKWMLMPAAAILLSLLATSHAVARVEGHFAAGVLTLVHQSASAVWVGGLCALLLATRAVKGTEAAGLMAKRFSVMSQWTVGMLLTAGVGLAVIFVGSWQGLYGTNYGVMVAAKTVLFGLMMLMGGLNYLSVGRMQRAGLTLIARVQRFTEVETGIGLTIVLTAASLTSQPPAVDLKQDRATVGDIVQRFTPQAPRLTTPSFSTLSAADEPVWVLQKQAAVNGYVPGQSLGAVSDADRAWSEYNHHWAGVVVLAAGMLAVLSRFQGMQWARLWPLAFIGLGVFLLLRADPENWPLGPNGFWESFAVADVAQHRLFVLLICGFAFFEWAVQTGRFTSQQAALVFPSACAVGGALLMTHTHALTNVRDELLVELSHIPLAIFGVVAGWARWLELRLLGPGRRIAGNIWPAALMMVGVVLLLYRES